MELWEVLDRQLPPLEVELTERGRSGRDLRSLARLTFYKLTEEQLRALFVNENWLNGYNGRRVDWLIDQWARSYAAGTEWEKQGALFDVKVRSLVTVNWLWGKDREKTARRLRRGLPEYPALTSRIVAEVEYLEMAALCRARGWIYDSCVALGEGVPFEYLVGDNNA